jgi:hypothetical protein
MGKLKSVDELFEGRHFDREIIILCVRWYLRFKLSLRDLVEMMAERGLSMAHTTIMRWCSAMYLSLKNAGEVCKGSRPIMASRRDIHQNPRRVVLPVSCHRSGRQDGRLQAERQT